MIEDQEQLFEMILEMALKGKLILWAGAGLSMEAGYPSGGQLADLLWQRLPEEERNDLQIDLLKVSDYYVNRQENGRKELIKTLKEIFEKEPQPSDSHEIIKKIAFIKTIVTTNYDKLFEEHIPDIEVLKTSKDLTRVKANSRKLIKIHGDLNSPKQLVLTESDYSKLYGNGRQDPFWSKVRVELTEKGVIFIGYGFNDLNVRGIFEYLHKKLKRHQQPKFLIAPNLSPPEKVKLESYGIQYLDSNGIEFLTRLYQEWKTTGFMHLGSDEVDTDGLINSLKHEGLSDAISIKSGGGRLFTYNPVPGKAWNLTVTSDQEEFGKRINDWQKGYGSDDLFIPKQIINEATLKIGDFVVGNQVTIPEFRFFRQGRIHDKVRIVFFESKIELENLNVRSYKYGEAGLKIIVSDQYACFTIVIPKISTSNFTYTGTIKPKEICESVSGLLKWYDAINALGNGEPFKIYSKELPKGYQDSNGGSFKNAEGFQSTRLVFQVLREIEEKFNDRFSEIKVKKIFSEGTLKRLNEFLHLFRENRFKPDYANGLPVRSISDDPEKDVIPLINEAAKDGFLIFLSDQNNVSLLNQEIQLGKGQLLIEKPILENMSSKTNEMIIKSGTNNYFVFYEAFGLATFKDHRND